MNTEPEGTVYCIGETVLDILFRQGRPVQAAPGGSMLNTAVSLGRAGIRVELISEKGDDEAGRMAEEFLRKNHVGTRYLGTFREGQTALALAFLDSRKDASYSFYKKYPSLRLSGELPEAGKGDIILFGSSFATARGTGRKTASWVRRSARRGAFIIYDPNFRKQPGGTPPSLLRRVSENISLAGLVRGSDEDFLHIFAVREPRDIYSRVASLGCPSLVITRKDRDVAAWFGGRPLTAKVPPVGQVASTVGAGDSFNAGMIYSLMTGKMIRNGEITGDALSHAAVLESGIRFASEVCRSLDNFIPEGFIKGQVK